MLPESQLSRLPHDLHLLPLDQLQKHEASLVIHSRLGNPDAFAALLRLVKPHVEAAVGRFQQLTWSEKEDAVQDAYIRLFRSLHAYRHDSSIDAYVRVIATRIAVDRFRSKKRQPTVSLETWMEPAVSPQDIGRGSVEAVADVMEKKGRRRQLWLAIESLPPVHRDLLEAHLKEDLSYEELAQRFDVKVVAVKSRLFRARQALFAAMGKTGIRMTPGRPH